MNKGSFWYLKWGFKNTIEILIKNIGNYFKYYVFLLAYMLSSFFIFWKILSTSKKQKNSKKYEKTSE